jgi:hypothetical protein
VDRNPATASSADAGWSWAPYAPDEPARFRTDQWASPASVKHPWVRVGRWTLLYRRAL